MSLRINHISFQYGPKKALNDVSFTCEPGQFTALLGPNGAGKSTLFSLLTRLLVAPQGSIRINDIELNKNPLAALAKLGIVFQQPTLDLALTVQQNLRYFAGLQGLSGKDAEIRIDQALERLNMRERAQEKAQNLNGGHKRRMEIARALIHSPSVLLLDEPTVGLDAAARKDITDHVHELAKTGLTVLWATHLVDEIYAEDALVILHRGKILSSGSVAEFGGADGLAERFLKATGGES